jgi:hypothetical protein
MADRASKVALVDQLESIISPATAENQLTIISSLAGTYDTVTDEASSTSLYVGQAAPGTPASSTGWRIKKVDTSVTPIMSVTWADGTSDFTKVWDNRATYSY